MELKVLTLNCWGVFVPFACKNKNERIREIGTEVGQGIYDVVLLQEIWCQADYLRLCEAICPALPYAHYFHGGIIGTGLCIFSKHVIMETSQHSYSLNGYAHRIFCGDWFGGKSVGLAKLMIQPIGILVNVYNTHLHAQYSPDNTHNSYDEHRCLQAFEMAKYIRDTSSGCDVVIAGGDFNTSSNQVGYQIIKSIANLEDSWKTQKNISKAEKHEPTCERPDNIFGPLNTHCPEGVRIDYLFHRQNLGIEVTCELCELAMRKIPGTNLPYSDHEGVAATYIINKVPQKKTEAIGDERDKINKAVNCLKEGMSLLENGMKKARSRRKSWLLISALLGGLLLALLEMQRLSIKDADRGFLSDTLPQRQKLEQSLKSVDDTRPMYERTIFDFYFLEFAKIFIVIGILFSSLHGLIVLTMEIITLKSVNGRMKMLTNYLSMFPKS